MMPPFRPLALAAALALSVPVASAQAQPAAEAGHELVIRDGRMFLDGRALPTENLPAGLDLDGLPETTVSFAGPVTPVLEIDGVVYVLEGEHLRMLSETTRAADRVHFLPVAPPAPEAAGPERSASAFSEAELSEAGEEAYLRQLSARDHSLYEQIEREHAIENETLGLADQIRRTPEGAERERLVRRLREKLDESFEMKQEIRASEIAQAEAQLGGLRRLLRERGDRKEQIIERRMLELMGAER